MELHHTERGGWVFIVAPISAVLQPDKVITGHQKAQELWLVQARRCGTACTAPHGQVSVGSQSWWAIEVL